MGFTEETEKEVRDRPARSMPRRKELAVSPSTTISKTLRAFERGASGETREGIGFTGHLVS